MPMACETRRRTGYAATATSQQASAVTRSPLQQRVVAKFIKLHHEGREEVASPSASSMTRWTRSRTACGARLEVFEQAMRNATPVLEVKPRRVGGSTYQVPVEIRGDRRLALAMRWLIRSARARSGRSMAEKLWPPSCWTRRTIPARRLSAVKIRTGWRRPTRPSPTIAGSGECSSGSALVPLTVQ